MTAQDTTAPLTSDDAVAADGAAPLGVATVLIGAIVLGSVIGVAAPDIGDRLSTLTDATLTLLIFVLFFELRLGAMVAAFGNLKFLSLAWAANFLIAPLTGFAIASVAVSSEPLLFAGLMIYFLAPCTDWFLGFTRMARGDVELGAALIPLNLITQLLLFPVWLWIFTQHTGLVDFAAMPGLLLQWFLLPLLAAQVLRFGLARLLSPEAFTRLLERAGGLVSLTLAALIVQLFAANVGTIAANMTFFALVAGAVFVFLVVTFFVGNGLARLARLTRPQHVVLTMTMAARNAPMMLALTAIAIPDQPLILAVIVFGMLIEIPHLTALKHLMTRKTAGSDPSRHDHTPPPRRA